MTRYSPTGFTAPMLATASTGASGRRPIDPKRLVDEGWIVQQKLDGIRAQIDMDGRIFSRTGVDITAKFPEIHLGNRIRPVIDGEIVAEDGSFETALTREAQSTRSTIMRMVITHPVKFVAFDVITEDRALQRIEHLLQLANDIGVEVVDYATHPTSGFYLVNSLREQGAEGVILRNPRGLYRSGRSVDVVKWKWTHRITCIGYGYEPGHGSRSHFGAMNIALLRGRQVVPIGRVGSGFTEKQTHDLKALFDEGVMAIPVEVEALNRTSSDQLRFPVFRGIRADKAIDDCTWDQLKELALA